MVDRQRRSKGSGGLFQRSSDGRWVAYVTLPDGPDGKPRRKVVSHKTREGAQAKLRTLNRDLARLGDLPTSSPTVERWMNRWLDQIAAPRLKPRTLYGYRGCTERYIIPAIGRIRLDRLTPAHIRRVHDLASADGRSSTTALQAHRILAKALTDAEREGLIPRNPAGLVDAPRRAIATRPALTADQARALLLSVAADEDAAVRWSLALLAGMRQGEALGLTRDQVDLETGTIRVSWQLQRLIWEHGCGKPDGRTWPCGRVRGGSCPDRHIDIRPGNEVVHVHGALWLMRPKSRAGWREIPMAPQLVEVMRLYLDTHEPGKGGLIVNRGGLPVDPRVDSTAWHAALDAAGLPSVPLHSARHTTATLLYQLGIPDQTRIQIMGHSSATVTAGYTHIAGAEMRDAMNRLGGLLAIDR